jgi:hypothetical protein
LLIIMDTSLLTECNRQDSLIKRAVPSVAFVMLKLTVDSYQNSGRITHDE